MRKMVVLTVAIVALMAISASAQAPFKFGVKGGFGIAGFSGDDMAVLDSKFGFGAGAFIQLPMGSMTLQPELLFIMKGAQATVGGIDTDIKLTYLEVPVLFKYSFPSGGTVSPSLFVGPTVGYNMGAKFGVSLGGLGGDVDISNAAGIEFGLTAGFGIGFGHWNVDARYGMGLTKVFDEVGTFDVIPDDEVALVALDGKSQSDAKNGMFSLWFGRTF